MSTNLASNLVGHIINNWTVIEKKEKKPEDSGGFFSSSYIVEHRDTKRKAFLKAINIGYSMPMFSGITRTQALQRITTAFNHEETLVKKCADRRLDKIVVGIESGEYTHAGHPYHVPYLIFELGDGGDVRRHTNMQKPNLTWRLRVFHHTCVGLHQLHSNGINHQDLKPSNVVIFGQTTAKIGDLGRATTAEPNTLYSEPQCWGDLDYQPIEFQYQYFEPDTELRVKAADIYMLGGILAYLTSEIHFFSHLLTKINPIYHPSKWTGGYLAALPAIQLGTNEAVADVIQNLPDQIKADIKALLLGLCHPEPSKRGHPTTTNLNVAKKFSLERVITTADLLATRIKCST